MLVYKKSNIEISLLSSSCKPLYESNRAELILLNFCMCLAIMVLVATICESGTAKTQVVKWQWSRNMVL